VFGDEDDTSGDEEDLFQASLTALYVTAAIVFLILVFVMVYTMWLRPPLYVKV
jgi:hypothetical protein